MKLLKRTEKVFDQLVSNVEDYKARNDHEYELKKLDKATRSYAINSTGDCCVGDEVLFIERVWERKAINRFGKMANVLADYNLVEAKIIKDSYGKNKQQHTFTLQLKDGSKKLIKGRNLYGISVWRKKWKNEEERVGVLSEKHERGAAARQTRYERKARIEF
ncbi:hypothetical protein ACMXYX_17945 (plasmid) [Neptuniibacter sp. QD72_48]|uniref:hypothetical protein n=1 Tax=Neptuniibacter sp. QD72_48 TaxID=3398214 RepID=UPI0039F61292